MLLDSEGRVVAATDRERLGQRRSTDPFFVQASRSPDTVFTSNEPETGRFDFTFSRAMRGTEQGAKHAPTVHVLATTVGTGEQCIGGRVRVFVGKVQKRRESGRQISGGHGI